VISSPATVANVSAPVASPAPARPAPLDAAYSGTTDSSRKKLVSEPKSATNRSSSGRVMIGGRAGLATASRSA
jgi:hypothetical protein